MSELQIVTREVHGELHHRHEVLRRIYAARGIDHEAQLDRSFAALLPPQNMPDINLAAQRLAAAVMQQQRIIIVGDFDADGATSVALCLLVLQAFGATDVDFLVPNRFEFGYGLSVPIVELAAARQPALIVTVDNGISSVEGVERANQLGIDVVVTDHHLPGTSLPPAYALVNPNLKDSQFASKSMAGVGVAYYLLSQVRVQLRQQGWFEHHRREPNMAQYLDLVALGTVADVVPLDQNNRVLVHQGIARMRAGQCRPGIKALAEIAKRPLAKLTAQDLAFAIGPRLNAAGRLEDMSHGIKCLLCEQLTEARLMARALDELNKTRRHLEQDMVADAQLMIADAGIEESRVGLTVYHQRFHQGVVGIVAGRLRERYHKPVIAFADAGDTAPDELKGSARSINDLHIRDVLDHIASTHPGLLVKFGGHAMAAGLSIKRVHMQRFAAVFDKAVRAFVNEDALQARLITDGQLQGHELTIDTAYELLAGGPWGSGFPEPSFVGDFELISQRVVGEQHLRMVLGIDGRLVDAIAFRQPPLTDRCGRVSLVYRLGVNDYGELPTLQLVVEYLQAIA